jgi:kynurenine formamidase
MNDRAGNELSNWNRWGADDQIGTLNLITPGLIKEAAGLVRTGRTYSLSVPLETHGAQWPPRHKMWRTTEFTKNKVGRNSSGDALVLHSHSGTHIDALCHIWYDDKLYNGFDTGEHMTSYGVTRNSIDNVPFLLGRGVLLDVAGWKDVEHLQLAEPITADDLDACAAAQETEIRSGDILLIRTGWINVLAKDRRLFDTGEPGIDESTLPWLKKHDVAAVGTDNLAVEVLESIPPEDLPIHRIGIRDLGLYLMELLDLNELAADRAYESFVVIAPLIISGGAGSPVNPIAIT